MGRAKIIHGRWTRRINWKWCHNGQWRTDMFKSTLSDSRLKEAEFVCYGKSGKVVKRIVISATELKKVLPNLSDHYHGRIFGPFNIDPGKGLIDGHVIQMEVLDYE